MTASGTSHPLTNDAERRAGWRWPLIVVGFLLFNVATQGVLLAFALNDPGFRLEPDYYQRAVSWDQERAEEARASALGWRLDLEVTPTPAGAQAVARLSEGGRPLTGLSVRLVAFHPAHKELAIQAVLSPGQEPGLYGADLPLRRAGRWVVRVEATGPGSPGGSSPTAAAVRRELRVQLPGAPR